jgi:hypothetical protein
MPTAADGAGRSSARLNSTDVNQKAECTARGPPAADSQLMSAMPSA